MCQCQPIIDGKQYASAGANYSFGINVNADDTNFPEVYDAFKDVVLVSNEPAVAGEEDLLNALNSDSGLMITAGGKEKGQQIIEHASTGDMTFDEIMAEWNAEWTEAQEANGVEITE